LPKKNLIDLEELTTKNHFTHPFFGDLKLKSATCFLKLQQHHLKIIEALKTKNPET